MINDNTNKVTYKGDGSTTVFTFGFQAISKSDLTVVKVDSEGNEIQLSSDYYVDLTKNTVTYPGYAPGEEPAESERPAKLAAGESLVIYRSTSITQESSLGKIWPFTVIEKGLDKLTMIIQDVYEKVNRSVKLPVGTSFKGDFTLPNPKAGNCIAWSSDGTKLENQDLLTPAKQLVEEAKTYAANAKTSETNTQTLKADVEALKTSINTEAENKKQEIMKFAMDLKDQHESDLSSYAKTLEDQFGTSSENAQKELATYVASAKEYAEKAEQATSYNPDEHYTKTEVDEKIKTAIAAIADYDSTAF